MQRLKNESLEDYQLRRKQTQKEVKQKLKGNWFYSNLKNSISNVLGVVKNVPYKNINQEEKQTKGVSFTQKLRNQKGYAKHLELKYS